jgi:hypothetical protein
LDCGSWFFVSSHSSRYRVWNVQSCPRCSRKCSSNILSGSVSCRAAIANSISDLCRRYFEAHGSANPAEWASLDSLHRKLVGPLRLLSSSAPLRIVIDALDEAPDASLQAIVQFLETVAGDPALMTVRTVVTARPDTPLPPSATVDTLEPATAEALSAYFAQRRLPADRIESAVYRADGCWLVAKLLADWAERTPNDFDPSTLAPGLGGIYDRALINAGAADLHRWRDQLRPVLCVLAVAGAGPVLPFPLFRYACGQLGGPTNNSRVRDVLVDLRGLIVRANPGSEEEQVGVFHPSFAEHLLLPGRDFSVEVMEGHTAIIKAIEELAPADRWDALQPDALQRYAFQRHADHLWAVGRTAQVVDCLLSRETYVNQESLSRWKPWLDRLTEAFGESHDNTRIARKQIAGFTAHTGDWAGTQRLYGELLSDESRVLGADHPDTLFTRTALATLTNLTGDPGVAVQVLGELLSDQSRVLGADHPDTLLTRARIASSIGMTGDVAGALRLYGELLPDQARVLGADHPDTLHTRARIASFTGLTGDVASALRLYGELLPDLYRVLGADHFGTLSARSIIARLIGLMFGDNYSSPLATITNPHQVVGITLRRGGLAQRSEPERSGGERSGASPPRRTRPMPVSNDPHRLA